MPGINDGFLFCRAERLAVLRTVRLGQVSPRRGQRYEPDYRERVLQADSYRDLFETIACLVAARGVRPVGARLAGFRALLPLWHGACTAHALRAGPGCGT